MSNKSQQQAQTAVLAIDGKQIPVQQGQSIYIDQRNVSKGNKIVFDKVLALFDDEKNSIGVPYVNNAKVTAKVLGQVRGEKIVVFKKKRRKGYKVKNGARKKHTYIKIKKIATA